MGGGGEGKKRKKGTRKRASKIEGVREAITQLSLVRPVARGSAVLLKARDRFVRKIAPGLRPEGIEPTSKSRLETRGFRTDDRKTLQLRTDDHTCCESSSQVVEIPARRSLRWLRRCRVQGCFSERRDRDDVDTLTVRTCKTSSIASRSTSQWSEARDAATPLQTSSLRRLPATP